MRERGAGTISSSTTGTVRRWLARSDERADERAPEQLEVTGGFPGRPIQARPATERGAWPHAYLSKSPRDDACRVATVAARRDDDVASLGALEHPARVSRVVSAVPSGTGSPPARHRASRE